MISKVKNFLKYGGLLSLVVIGFSSCEKELENIGVDLIDNNTFTTNKESYKIAASTVNIERIPANNIGQYLLGVYNDEEFGTMEASIATQLVPQNIGEFYTFGENVTVDAAIIEIPYQFSQTVDDSSGKPQFELDSIFGNADVPFKLEIFELQTYLNQLNPQDPTKNAVYYTDKEFQKGVETFYSDEFKVNPNDTIAYINRFNFDNSQPNNKGSIYDTDTIKATPTAPSIKISLDEELIKQFFIDNAETSNFDSKEAFKRYFKGLYLEASVLNSVNSHLISLSLANAKMTLFYSNDKEEADGTDINGNGTEGEGMVRVNDSYVFNLNGVNSNVIKRDYTISKKSGEDKLYVQGTNGSMLAVDLFVNENLTELRNRTLLVNNASLTFHIVEDASTSNLPEKLFIYNLDNNEQLIDVFTEGFDAIEGERDFTFNDLNEKVYQNSYTFNITNYISEVLKTEDPADLFTLGIKVFNPSYIPEAEADKKVDDLNWNPQGVVFYGTSAIDVEKQPALNINYTEVTN